MPGKPKSTHCRYCGQTGDLVKGAHLKCFNAKPCFDASIAGAKEAYNRKKRIQKLMRVDKMMREEAELYYDSKSLNCGCGATKARNAKYCPACAKRRASERSAAYEAANREKIRRADVIRKRIANGMSREQAEAVEDAKGTCACGRPARFTNGRICKECYKAKDRAAHEGVVRLVDKTCAHCGAAFKGTPNAKYCDAHKMGVRQVKAPAIALRRKEVPKVVVVDEPLPPPPPEMLARVVRHEIKWSRWDD